MSPTVVSSWAIILTQVLPPALHLLNVNITGEALTTTVQTLAAVIGGVVILFRRVSKGGVTLFGRVV